MSAAPPTVRANVLVRLPDGTDLATDIYRPSGAEPLAVVLLRTPYGKAAHLDEGLGWVRHGFGFVVQDVRGRYDSEGVWHPYRHERLDGAAVLEWLARQEWANGGIVLAGGSYAAFTAWAAALHSHPSVRAIISVMPAAGLHAAMYSPSGVLRLTELIVWWMTFGDSRTQRPGLFATMCRAVPSVLSHLPVTDLSTKLWAHLPNLNSVIEVEPDPSRADALDDDELARLDLPAMHIGGWHDGFVDQTLRHWSVVGSAVEPRPERRLVVGPWTHKLEFDQAARIGGRCYGESSRVPLGIVQVAWLRHVLGIPGAVPAAPPVKVFLVGTNRWLEGEDWPPREVHASTWYAREGGGMSRQPSPDRGADTFVYNPDDPFPSRSKPVKRADLDARADAIRYVTAPLEAPMSILGHPVVTLHAATDGPGTDWVVRLLEVLPNGRTLYVSYGLVDAAREATRRGVAMAAGERCRYRIEMTPTAITVRAGHRLCLEISSSDFPEHSRNLNTGGDRYTTSDVRVAHQTVFRGPSGPTSLMAPVARRVDDA